MMSFDAFISYAHQDKATADATCAALEAHRIRCWIAPRDVPPGTEWAESIVDAIDTCRVVIVIFSSNANQSKQIHREVQQAFDKGLPVLPFRIEDVSPSKALSYYISPVHWLDALTPPLEKHLEQLVASVQALLNAANAAAQTVAEQRPSFQLPRADQSDARSEVKEFPASPVVQRQEPQSNTDRRLATRRFVRLATSHVLAPVVLVLAVQYLVLFKLDVNPAYLRAFCGVIIPLPFGFTLRRGTDFKTAKAILVSFLIAILAVIGMLNVSAGLNSGSGYLSAIFDFDARDAREVAGYMLSIMLGHLGGYIIASFAPDNYPLATLMRWVITVFDTTVVRVALLIVAVTWMTLTLFWGLFG